MKKNILFYVLLFICLFGFLSRVEAKEYTLDYSKKKTALDEYCYAAANSSYACKAYCKGKEITGTDRLGVTNGAGVTADIAFMNDHHCKGSKIEVKVNVDKPSDFNMKVNEMQIKDSLDSYCKSFSSSDFCKMYKGAEDSTTSVDTGEDEDDVICTANKLSWLGDDEHPGFKHPSMSIRYNPSSGKVFVMSPAGDTNSDYFETGGKRYYFYSYSSKDNSKEGFEAFKNGLAEKYKAASSSDYSNLCNGIFVFCPLKEDFNEWYAELASPDTKCDTINSAYLPYTQSVGGSSSGEIDIQLSPEENRDRAKELIQDEVSIKTCSDLFKGDGDNTILLDILKILVGTVKVLVPVILLVLGSIDFAKAIIAQDENGIKKAQSKFIKRLIIAVAIFLIPTIIKTLLDIAHSVWPDIISSSEDVFCGIL